MRILTAVLSLLACAPTLPAQSAKPNIVLIVSDDQGYADLGCCGRPELKTPNLDRLAAEGVRLTNFYVTWPACTPSRGSLLTGRYPQRNGLYDMIRNNEVNYGHRFTEEEYAVSPEMTLGLDRREVTIAEVLREAGYATGVFGKWDSGRAKRFLPQQRGFDTFFGFANTGVDYFTHERYGVPSMYRGNDRIKVEGYATDLFRREAIEFLNENSRRPFFLYVPFNAPHGASNLDRVGVQAPDEYYRMYGDLPPTRKQRYMAATTAMDDAIGKILDEIDRLGVADNTLVVFFSDNGGSGVADNTPLRGRKAQLWEGGIRVPFLARWPGHLPPGKVIDEFLSSLEVFPTFTAAAGGRMPENVIYDGFDMLPVLRGEAESRRSEMYWQRRSHKAARYENWKWVEAGENSGLFNLASDIGEQRDLSSSHPDVLRDMRARWAVWRRQMDEAEPRGPFRDY
jgi:arylsulfatase A-like enzyme